MALRYYWAIIEKSTDGFYAFLPDLPGATAAGDSVEEALRWMAEIAADHIRDGKERGGEDPPEATKLEDIPHDPEIREYGRVLLPVELPAKAVKISVTVDEGVLARIDRAASEAGTKPQRVPDRQRAAPFARAAAGAPRSVEPLLLRIARHIFRQGGNRRGAGGPVRSPG